MKILRGKELLIVGVLLLTVIQILDASQTPHSRNKRQAPPSAVAGEMNNDLDLTSIKLFLDKIPFLGPVVNTFYNYVSELLINADQLTNGFLSRMLGGSLPCELTINELVCSGTSKNGGTYGVVKRIVEMLPNTIVPDDIKDIILDFISMVINPIVNTLFGGLPK